MPLLGLDRFARSLANITLFKGPYAPELLESLQPVWDLSSQQPEFDDRIVFWHTTSKALAALAANFSTITIRIKSGNRAVVDGVSILAQAGQQTYVMNLANGGAVVAPVAAWQSNIGTTRFNQAPPISFQPIEIDSEQSVGGRLAGAGYAVTSVANGGAMITRLGGGLPGFVITPSAGAAGIAYNLVIETSAVNQAIGVAAWGRWYPETQPG